MKNNETLKIIQLNEIEFFAEQLQSKPRVLSALDTDTTTTDCGDLTDQLTTFAKNIASIQSCVTRSKGVCGVGQ